MTTRAPADAPGTDHRTAPDDGIGEADPSGQMDRADLREAERRAAPGAHIVHEAILAEGEEEISRPASALAWSGLAAGLSMGLSLLTQGLFRAHLPTTVWTPLVADVGYTLGFLVVILGRQQLFTETTLTAILPILDRPSLAMLARITKVWSLVLATNLIGGFLFAWGIGREGLTTATVQSKMVDVGVEAAHGDFLTIFLSAIIAGWMIALMVWLLPFAGSSRVLVVVIVTYVVGLGGFAHSIAGSIEVLFAVLHSDHVSWAEYGIRFLIPALLGNIVGGVALVAALNHAQVTAG